MWDLIKREPARFGGVVHSLFGFIAVVVALLLPADMDVGAKAALSGAIVALGNATAEFVRHLSVPTVKLSEAAIEKAADMTKADIKKVEAAK